MKLTVRPLTAYQEEKGGVARRWAHCPKHDIRCTRWIGVQESGWVFRCYRGEHLFIAAPDPAIGLTGLPRLRVVPDA